MAAKAYIALGLAAISALGSIKQGNAQQAAAESEALNLRNQGVRDQQIAIQQSEDFRRDQSRKKATLRANQAGSGGTLEGSALAVLSDLAAETEFQAQRIEAGGKNAAISASNAAAQKQFAGRQAVQAGQLKAGTTLLTTAVGVSGSFGPATPTGFKTDAAGRILGGI